MLDMLDMYTVVGMLADWSRVIVIMTTSDNENSTFFTQSRYQLRILIRNSPEWTLRRTYLVIMMMK